MKSAKEHGHLHGEAFMLMRYACQSCGKNEMLWNSRDGVTPFSIGCSRNGCKGMMNHVDFNNDIYAPDYRPGRGQRFFRDGTPEEAADIMRRRIKMLQDQYPTTPEYEQELIEGARNAHKTGDDNFHEFQAGWPNIAVMTENRGKIFVHTTGEKCTDGEDHDFTGGYREFPDGNGGEQVCVKCGLGAMAWSLRFGP